MKENIYNTNTNYYHSPDNRPEVDRRNYQYMTELNRGTKSAEKKVGKYKSELCKNWIEVGFCRYRKQCKFAHGQNELSVNKTRQRVGNCKTFFTTGQCPYGVRCYFLHEHRSLTQIKRYHYTVKLYTLESIVDELLTDNTD